MTKMYRKTTCNGCGFTQETFLTYLQDKKQWQTNHLSHHLSVLPLTSDVRALLRK